MRSSRLQLEFGRGVVGPVPTINIWPQGLLNLLFAARHPAAIKDRRSALLRAHLERCSVTIRRFVPSLGLAATLASAQNPDVLHWRPGLGMNGSGADRPSRQPRQLHVSARNFNTDREYVKEGKER